MMRTAKSSRAARRLRCGLAGSVVMCAALTTHAAPWVQAGAAAGQASEVQDPAQEPPIDEGDPAAAEAEAAPPAGADAAAQAAAMKASTILRQLQRPPLQRTPDSVLAARAELALMRAAPPAEAPPDETAPADPDATGEASPTTPTPAPVDPQAVASLAQHIRRVVIAGEWDTLATLLPDELGDSAHRVYSFILNGLSAADQAILPFEIVPLSHACPGELTDSDMAALGKILKSAAGRASVDGLVTALESGEVQIGKDAERARSRAADLLVLADLGERAYPFLPPLDSVAEPDAELYNRHAFYHQHQAIRATDLAARRAEQETAWRLYNDALAIEAAPADLVKQIMGRTMDLMAEMPEHTREQWLQSIFIDEPRLGAAAIARVAEQSRQMRQSNGNLSERARAIEQARTLAETLLDVAGPDDRTQWQSQLDMLALNFVEEESNSGGQTPRIPANLPPGYTPEMYLAATRSSSNNRSLSDDQLLRGLPGPLWIAAIEPGLGEKLLRSSVRIHSASGNADAVMSIITRTLDRRRDLAQELAEVFMREWSKSLNPNQSVVDPYAYQRTVVSSGGVYYPPNYTGGYGNAMPLTRTRQVQALEKLAAGLRELEALGLDPINPGTLVSAFTACHSAAEVFRLEDIERTFGPIESRDAPTLAALSGSMRSSLNSRWRDPRAQQQAGTRRDDEQIRSMVERGYELAMRLARLAVERGPDSASHMRNFAMLAFDQAEYQHAADPHLETYAPLRDRAFAAYADAARLYLDDYHTERARPSAQYFLDWFTAALGASEQGFLTPDMKPDNDQIEQLRVALDQLPGGEEQEHIGLFATAVSSYAQRVPPHSKPRFIRHAARIIGDHPDGDDVRDLIRFYEELSEEVKLAVEIDGPADVAANEPFGFRVAIRFTDAIGRESGGFDKYLHNQVYQPTTGVPIDHQQNFSDIVQEALADTFEIIGVAFHQPDVPVRSFGVAGWLEKPLAYVVVSPRDSSVDRIPPVHIDMDFSDGQGTILLPIQSEVELIDAGAPAGAVRPVRDLAADLVLDDRDLDQNLIRLEVRARGKGVIPDVHHLLAGLDAMPGFTMTGVEDHGLNIVEIDPEAPVTTPLAERSWFIEYEPRPGDGAAQEFHFPAAAQPDTELTYQRYDDLDIVEVAQVVPLDPDQLPGGRGWIVALVVMLLAGTLAVAAWLFTRKQRGHAEQERAFAMPEIVTPLNTITILRRMRATNGSTFDAQLRAELEQEADELERIYFGPGERPDGEHELRITLEKWFARFNG